MRRLALCAVLVAACSGGGGDHGTDDAHQECVDYTNMYRTGNGKAAVTRSADLEAYADDGAAYDYDHAAHDHFSMDPVGGGIAFAENECPHWDLSFGNGDLNALVDACIDAYVSEGPGGGHYENLMGNYGTLGCGIYSEGTDYTIVQDYGQ
jgi:hypothetical protein